MAETSKRARKLARKFDFECTESDDHDYPHCRKCKRMRAILAQRIDEAVKPLLDALYTAKLVLQAEGAPTRWSNEHSIIDAALADWRR